jgi:23S rRNA (uracil1939-C5)-methyltransferase
LFSGLGLNINVGEVVGIPDGFNYRNKIQYPVGSKKGQTRILAGYYQQATHELINIKYCPIQPDAVNDVMEFIKLNAEKYGISAYDEKKYSGLLRHIVIRVSEYDYKMIVSLVLNAVNIDGAVKKLAQDLYDNFDCVVGVSANFNTQKSNVILCNKSQLLFGQDYVEEKLSGVVFKISADTFFTEILRQAGC